MKKSRREEKKLVSQMHITDTRRQTRAEQISCGIWMGRNSVHRSATDYNRQKAKLETKHLCEGAW